MTAVWIITGVFLGIGAVALLFVWWVGKTAEK